MNKIFKTTGDKLWFAFFVPVTIRGYLIGSTDFLWYMSTVLGVFYISWSVYKAFFKD